MLLISVIGFWRSFLACMANYSEIYCAISNCEGAFANSTFRNRFKRSSKHKARNILIFRSNVEVTKSNESHLETARELLQSRKQAERPLLGWSIKDMICLIQG